MLKTGLQGRRRLCAGCNFDICKGNRGDCLQNAGRLLLSTGSHVSQVSGLPPQLLARPHPWDLLRALLQAPPGLLVQQLPPLETAPPRLPRAQPPLAFHLPPPGLQMRLLLASQTPQSP